MLLYILLGLLVSALSCCGQEVITKSTPVPTEDYVHSLSLDELQRYFLFWKFTREDVTLEVHVRTRGWVGFGLSANGGMKGADIAIGWVKDGRGVLYDCFAVGNQRPQVDEEQNWELVHASENKDFTVMKFTRSLESCDADDRDITEGTLRLLFAWGEQDPESLETLPKHEYDNRGTRSLMLLDYGRPNSEQHKQYENMKTFDIRVVNATLKENRTTYFCRIHGLPPVTSKHHIVRVDPLIEKRNLAVVHHIVLYACYGQLEQEEYGRVCWEGNMPDNATKCDSIMVAWAVGQETFYYPQEAGCPIGTPDAPRFVQLEMHYDNPEHIPDITDSSGLRIYYTDRLRKYDAGTFIVGHTVWWPPIVIPPGAEKFQIDSYCNKDCTQRGLPKGGIHVFASLLHTHLVGDSMIVRHIREGEELKEIAREDYYDFNYQQLRVLSPHVNIKPGDEIFTQCYYKTKNRNKMTFGGPGSDNEMCLSFMLYYPAVPLQACLSVSQEAFSVHQWVTQMAMSGKLHIDPNDKDSNIYDHLDRVDWTEENIQSFQEQFQMIHGYRQTCSVGRSGENVLGNNRYTFHPLKQLDKPYYKPTKCRQPEASAGSTLCLSVIVIISWVGVIFH